jgi:hypothetical protein
MKDRYKYCSICRRLQDHLAAAGREYSAALNASFEARGSAGYAHARDTADAADAAYFRFLKMKADLEQHLGSGTHDYASTGGAAG